MKWLVGPDATGTWVELYGQSIERVGFGDPPPPCEQQVQCPQAQIRPGFVNAHTHIYSGLVPLGMPAPSQPPENFVQILERVWWLLDRALDEESVRASARYYVANALLSGTTALIDHHESPGFITGSLSVIGDVCDELGMRAVLAYGATERNGGRAEAQQGLDECRRFIKSTWSPLLRGAVALHASFTVSDETIREAGELCEELDTIMHVHLAEDGADVEDAIKRGYSGPLERLVALGALPEGSICAHGVHLNDAQVVQASELGVWFVQNPRSNEGNDVGYPVGLRRGERVALGTDGYAAAMRDELRELHRIGSIYAEDPVALEDRLQAGRALLSERFGAPFALEQGALGDVVVLDGDDVRDVFVNGRRVVADGQLVNADLAQIEAEAQACADALWARMSELAADG